MNDKTPFWRSFLFSPVVFVCGLLALALVWAALEPNTLHHAFDQDGYSPFELATIPFYAAVVPLVWWKCPFSGSRARRTLLCAAVSCVALMAVVKEMDLHLWAMQRLFPDIVGADGSVHGLVKPNGDPLTGTPFKMRFLTNAGAPFAAKCLALFYFASFFGVFAALLGYYTLPFWVKPSLLEGVFGRHPVAWSVGCLGSAGVMVQLCDRVPAWYRHAMGLAKPKEGAIDAVGALFTAFEEGGELLIALFALIAILQAHALYGVRAER